MKREKLIYLSPETETLVVRAEGCLCGSPLNGANTSNRTEYLLNEAADYGYEEL